MPNHIDNRLTVIGAPERVSAFAEQARAVPPQPGLSRDPIFAKAGAAARARGPKLPQEISFAAIVPLPAAYETEPYDPFGYNAEHATWGVKWGAYQVRDAERSDDGTAVTYAFQTAWSAPERWLAQASIAWPDLTFALSFGGEGPARGRLHYRGGEALLSRHDDYDEADYPRHDECDEDGEDGECAACAAYEAAEQLHVTTHDAWIAGLR